MALPAKTGEELQILHGGATVSDLCTIFDLSRKQVNERIAGKVVPVTAEYKVPRYRIRDVAPYLCEVEIDVEQVLKTLSPSKLPVALHDGFWKAMNGRQKFEENRGDLWRTDRVVEVIASAFKTVRMTILMMSDTVEQMSELTAGQREEIQKLGDSILAQLQHNLLEEFTDRVPVADEHGMPLKESDVLEAMENNEHKAISEVAVLTNDDNFDDGFGDDS